MADVDFLGTPDAYSNWNQRQFIRALDRHTAHDFLVIDLTGADISQVEAIFKHVDELPAAVRGGITPVGW